MAVPSGTQAFSPAFSDLLLDVYARLQVRPSAITADHMTQARFSANLMLSEWAVANIPRLWKMEEIVIPLDQGVAQYALPATTVGVLDWFIRQYDLNPAVSAPVAVSTTLNSTTVSVTLANHGMGPGDYVSIVVPVAVGGLILLGFYQVETTPDVNTFTVTAGAAATATVVGGGAVPVFVTTANSATVTVTLADHGLSVNQAFAVQVPTQVGGITLSGAYAVTAVTDANTFTFNAGQVAGVGASAAENGDLASFSTQNANTDPIDRIIFSMSRSDYAAQPDKKIQAWPTTVWFNRQITPVANLWPVPDQNGPYELHAWALVQFDDVVTPGGVGLDLPWRFLEAFAAGLAAKLAVKYPPPPPNSIAQLVQLADRAWDRATIQDTEDTPIYIAPMIGAGYWG